MRLLGLGRREHSDPISEGTPVAGRHYLVRAGDDLKSIAVAAYGDPQYADDIAQKNGLPHGAEPEVGSILDLPKRRKMLFGERIDARWLVPAAPVVAGTGFGVHEALGSAPVTAGESNKTLVQQAPERMSLGETLASRGLTIRAFASSVVDPLTPAEERKAQRLLRALGFTADSTGIAQFQTAVGIDASGILSGQTLRKLESTKKRIDEHDRGYLTQGMKGPEVKKLQQRLKRLGDFRGSPDGIYGESTSQAVLDFRARHSNLDNGIRSWSAKCQKTLREELANIAHDPFRDRVKPSERRERLDRETAREARTNGVGKGSPGHIIRYVKEHLAEAGYNTNSKSRRWTDHTQAMMQQFLRRGGHEVTERLEIDGWRALRKSTIETKSRFTPKMDVGERSSAVLHLERDLRDAGANIDPDRRYTKRTERVKDAVLRQVGVRGTDGAGNRVHRLIHERIREVQKRSVRGCAKLLLQSNNVSYWQGLSTGPDIRAIEQIARTGKSFVPVTGRWVKPKLSLMQALVEMSEKGRVQINALTGGTHSSLASRHYQGDAVDLAIEVGDTGEIVSIANEHGGFRNNETTHIHLQF
jgi:peptidoglycan hydrolase-like protein with peptidoglycan-binding domain